MSGPVHQITTAVVLSAVVAGCAGEEPAAATLDVETVARGLETPWALAFAPDGRLFIAERPGRIRVVDHDSLLPEPWAVLDVHESAGQSLETGLMGLAVDPDFSANSRVYVCYTYSSRGALRNRIAVLAEGNGKGENLQELLSDIPAASYHNGCRMKFGPDGKLYATTGDASESRDDAATAQSLSSLAGKVLRLNTDGTVPDDNPYPGSYVWSVGHRNSQGLAFDPQSGRLFATEHGTGKGGNNELNIISKGQNYGWPVVIGIAADTQFIEPILVIEDAPAGAAFVSGDSYPELRGNLLIASIGTRRLIRIALSSDETPRVLERETLIDGTYGRLRDVVQGPDGLIYLATSNRDGRGQPGADDDRVLRLIASRR
jgi:glucose/arabinose dehydrogenase